MCVSVYVYLLGKTYLVRLGFTNKQQQEATRNSKNFLKKKTAITTTTSELWWLLYSAIKVFNIFIFFRKYLFLACSFYTWREWEREKDEWIAKKKETNCRSLFAASVCGPRERDEMTLQEKKKFRLAVPSRKKTEKIPCFSHHHYCRPTIHRFLTDVMFHQSLPSIISHLKRLWSSYFCCFFLFICVEVSRFVMDWMEH